MNWRVYPNSCGTACRAAAIALTTITACTPIKQVDQVDAEPTETLDDGPPLNLEVAWRAGYESVIRMLEHTGSTGIAEWQSADEFSSWRVDQQDDEQAGGNIVFDGDTPEGRRVGRFTLYSDGRISSLFNQIAEQADYPDVDEHGNEVNRPQSRSRPQWTAAKAVRVAREALMLAGIEIPEDYDLTTCRYFDYYVAWTIRWEQVYAGGRLYPPNHSSNRQDISNSIRITLCENHGVLNIRTMEGIVGDISVVDPVISSEEAAVKAAAVVPALLRDEINPWSGAGYEFRGVERVHLVARIPTWDLDPVRGEKLKRGEIESEPPRLAWAVEMIGGVPQNASATVWAARPEIQVFVDAITGEIIALDYSFGTGR